MKIDETLLLSKLRSMQSLLEEFYGAPTALNVCDFVKVFSRYESQPDKQPFNDIPAQLLLRQEKSSNDLDIALMLDRDIFSASGKIKHRSWAILFEEISHFVYLCFNHNRGRNVSRLEMELQSEVDRFLLAHLFRDSLFNRSCRSSIIHDLFESPYEDLKIYEKGRKWAIKYLRKLSIKNPEEWGLNELQSLRQFFHRDLAEKIHLLRS